MKIRHDIVSFARDVKRDIYVEDPEDPLIFFKWGRVRGHVINLLCTIDTFSDRHHIHLDDSVYIYSQFASNYVGKK